ncbi:MAG: tetratricopeptide repeat protein, partial [Anaerolineae bacterium]|nr:tetratricopeptide repeat protein [Anaerolineae bacterium]
MVKLSAFLLMICALLVFRAPSVLSQDAVEIRIFRDADSLTVYVPQQGEVSLNGLTFEVTIRKGDTEQTLARPLPSFPEFRALPFDHLSAPLCLRLERSGSPMPAPIDCASVEMIVQPLAQDDLFWYDAALKQNRLLLVKNGALEPQVCVETCELAYLPSAFTTPATIPGCMADLDAREVLVLIAPFKQLSEPDIYPEREWESILNEAIAELGSSTHARVLVLDDTVIESHDEARAYSDLCLATLVIWGEMGRTKIRSAYTVTPRWGLLYTEPGETDVKASSAAELPELEIFISSFGGDSPYVLQLVLGQLAFWDEDYEAALPFFEDATRLIPAGREAEMGVFELHVYLGYTYLKTNNMEKAIAAYDQALALRPELDIVFTYRGLARYALGDLAGAVADYDQAIALSPEYAFNYNNRGGARYAQGDLAGAIADFDRTIALDPDFAYAYYNRGIVRHDQGDLAGAIADYDQAIALDPEYADAYTNRGLARYALGDPEGAIADYDQTIALNPNFAYAYNNRGNARYTQGDLEGAIADYDRAIALDPNFADVYYNRGTVHYAQGDLEGAIADYGQAIALDSNYADAYNNRGLARYARGDLDRAIADYDQAIALDPDAADAYNNRANARRVQGDLNGAIADYDRAIALDSNYDDAYYNRANARRVQGDLNGAIADYDQVIALNPQFFKAYHNRGWMRFLLGDHPSAVADWNQEMILQAKHISSVNIAQGQGDAAARIDQEGSQTHFQFTGVAGSAVSIHAIAENNSGLDTIVI